MSATAISKKLLTDYFTYLDELRESGVTNMFGAAEYIENTFDLQRSQAKKVLMAWMNTFDGETSSSDRAEKAQI